MCNGPVGLGANRTRISFIWDQLGGAKIVKETPLVQGAWQSLTLLFEFINILLNQIDVTL
jgi:hypothetical protein